MVLIRRRQPIRKTTTTLIPQTLSQLRHAQLPWLLLVCILAAGVSALLDLRGFTYFEQYAYSLRIAIFGERYFHEMEALRRRIVLVPISDATFSTIPGTVIPRVRHAHLLRLLQQAGASVAVFDLVFDVPHLDEDETFADAAASFHRVAWACLFENQDTPEEAPVWPVKCLLRASPYPGHIVMPVNNDQSDIFHLSPVMLNNGKPIPALSVQATRLALGLEGVPLQRVPGGWKLGNRLIPIDAQGNFNITFFGKPDESFLMIPYEQVDDSFYQTNHFFRNKIVIIGNTSTLSNDHRHTPVGDMWGMEIHAHTIATLLQGRFIREAPSWVNWLAIMLLSLFTLVIVWNIRLLWISPAMLGILVGFFVVNSWLFVDGLWWVHLIAPLNAALMVGFGTLIGRWFIEERQKKKMHGLLERYVSPQVASYIIANPEHCVLGCERASGTVLFADIRGFTTISERSTPEQVAEMLNEYFQAMTDVIYQHDGTVDKYIGDAIMALFGLPVPSADHAQRAVRTALAMREALGELQQQRQVNGLPVFDIGIGIHTGEMVVGNIGALQRQDFTVIGDTVNLASRLESLCKDMNENILISAETFTLAQQEIEVNGPFLVQVKGKQHAVTIYAVKRLRSNIGEL